jgi:hypothetical protein
MTLYSSVRTTLAYNDTRLFSPFHDDITEFDCVMFEYVAFTVDVTLRQMKSKGKQ